MTRRLLLVGLVVLAVGGLLVGAASVAVLLADTELDIAWGT